MSEVRSLVAPEILRRMVRHLEIVGSRDPARSPGHERILAEWRRRTEARSQRAAEELAAAANAAHAPPRLRALASAVRMDVVTWRQCVTGRADHIAEVQACLTAEQPPVGAARRWATADANADDDDVVRQFLH